MINNWKRNFKKLKSYKNNKKNTFIYELKMTKSSYEIKN